MKKRKQVSLAVLLLLSLCLVMSGCSTKAKSQGTSEASDVRELRFAYASNSQPVIDAMRKFGELVEEKTNGEVTVTYFPDGQLGGERELIELTQSGAIDFTKVSASALESFSKQYAIYSLPYLFDDETHFFKAMNEETLMAPIYASTKDLGFQGLTYYDSGQRSFYMVDGPVKSPDDLKGKKIRVMQSETAIKMVKLLGGSPVPMGSDEVYTSLQSNLINGSENNEFVLYTAGHGGVAKYYSYDEHTRVPDIVIMNEAIRDTLTEAQVAAIEEAAKESTRFEIAAFKQAIEDEKQIAQTEYDVQFFDVDNAPFREAVKPLHEEFQQNETFKDLYTTIRSFAK